MGRALLQPAPLVIEFSDTESQDSVAPMPSPRGKERAESPCGVVAYPESSPRPASPPHLPALAVTVHRVAVVAPEVQIPPGKEEPMDPSEADPLPPLPRSPSGSPDPESLELQWGEGFRPQSQVEAAHYWQTSISIDIECWLASRGRYNTRMGEEVWGEYLEYRHIMMGLENEVPGGMTPLMLHFEPGQVENCPRCAAFWLEVTLPYAQECLRDAPPVHAGMKGEKCSYCRGWSFEDRATRIRTWRGIDTQNGQTMVMVGREATWSPYHQSWILTLPAILGRTPPGLLATGIVRLSPWGPPQEAHLAEYFRFLQRHQPPSDGSMERYSCGEIGDTLYRRPLSPFGTRGGGITATQLLILIQGNLQAPPGVLLRDPPPEAPGWGLVGRGDAPFNLTYQGPPTDQDPPGPSGGPGTGPGWARSQVNAFYSTASSQAPSQETPPRTAGPRPRSSAHGTCLPRADGPVTPGRRGSPPALGKGPKRARTLWSEGDSTSSSEGGESGWSRTRNWGSPRLRAEYGRERSLSPQGGFQPPPPPLPSPPRRPKTQPCGSYPVDEVGYAKVGPKVVIPTVVVPQTSGRRVRVNLFRTPERPAEGCEKNGKDRPVGGRWGPPSKGEGENNGDRTDGLELEGLEDILDHAEGVDDLLRKYAPRPGTPPPGVWQGDTIASTEKLGLTAIKLDAFEACQVLLEELWRGFSNDPPGPSSHSRPSCESPGQPSPHTLTHDTRPALFPPWVGN